MGVKKAVGSFFAGLIMTIVLVVVVPVLINKYITGIVADAVGDNSFLFLTSDVLTWLIVYGILFAFMILLGAGGIFKKFGIIGILGLIAAYWLMGDVTKAILPLLILCAVLVVTWNLDLRKKRRESADSNSQD